MWATGLGRTRTRLSTPLLTLPLAAAGLAALLLTACGDSALPAASDPRAQEAAASAFISIAGSAPLLDDNGLAVPSIPDSVPADAAAQTRAGRYATAMQAAQLEHAFGDSLLRLELAGPAAGAVEQAMQRAARAQSEAPIDAATPVLVYAMGHLRAAAVVAERLSDDGHSRVWVVTN